MPAICSVHDVEAERLEICVLKRGLLEKKGKRVEAGYPTALVSEANRDLSEEAKKKPRLALAKWLTAPEHPLTARVFVNRVWQYHFGRGLVETPNDFGVNGARRAIRNCSIIWRMNSCATACTSNRCNA